MRAGTARRVDAIAVDGEANLSVPTRFAPGAENCEINYIFRRGVVLGDVPVTLEIKDKDDTVVAQEDDLADGGDREDIFDWDGRDTGGDFVTPQKSPYTVTLKMGDIVTRICTVNVEIGMMQISLINDAPRMYMNDPNQEIAVEAIIKLRRTNGTFAKSAVPQEVKWSYVASSNNMSRRKSFEYNSAGHLKLGKKNSDVHWSAHPNSTARSDDNYQQACLSQSVAAGLNLGKAFINFKPTGVGGDTFTIKGEIFEDDNSTLFIDIVSAPFVVWRRINFSDVYTMHDENYINNSSSHDNIRPAYDREAFVHYRRNAVTNLDAALSVRYIGLYIAGGGQQNWPVDFAPWVLETYPNQLTPTAQELANYSYRGINPKRLIQILSAKTAIENKAQLWFEAIVQRYRQATTAWFNDAGIDDTQNSLLAVKYYHPKLSGQGLDGVTNFWPAGIQINLANPHSGRTLKGHPDRPSWRNVKGFNRRRISVIFKNYPSPDRLITTCRHEIGHATKSTFYRDRFGTGDHSKSGLMTATASSNTFRNADIRILRGRHR